MTKEKRQKKQLAHEKRMQALNKQKDMSNSEDVQTENNVQNSIQAPEGQLISKCSFGVFRLVHVVGRNEESTIFFDASFSMFGPFNRS